MGSAGHWKRQPCCEPPPWRHWKKHCKVCWQAGVLRQEVIFPQHLVAMQSGQTWPMVGQAMGGPQRPLLHWLLQHSAAEAQREKLGLQAGPHLPLLHLPLQQSPPVMQAWPSALQGLEHCPLTHLPLQHWPSATQAVASA